MSLPLTPVVNSSSKLFNYPLPPPNRTVVSRCSYSPMLPPSSPAQETLNRIKSSGIIACLRANSAEVAAKAAEAAIDGGIAILEITTSTPGVFEVLHNLSMKYPSVILGIGTVLSAKDAKQSKISGAKFLMSPAFVEKVLEDIRSDEVLYIPGVMTPTEILSAYEAGARILKVYPISCLGGVQYLSALKKPFPHIPLVASQGITIDSIGDYISRGAEAVVLSDALFDKKALDHRNFNTVRRLASLATSKSREATELKKRGPKILENNHGTECQSINQD